MDEAADRFRSGDARHPLEVELAEDLPLVMADRLRVVQVLSNLLSNAAGYSPEGSPILVSAALEGVHVAVSVTDKGRGIPAELLPELFRKFSRGYDAGAAPGVDGSGLGLAICKGIAEAHGGRMRAESDGPGLGARFHLHASHRGGTYLHPIGSCPCRPAFPVGRAWPGAGAGGGRRPPGAAVRARRAHPCR